jgi:hypothetical protein
VRGVHLLTVTVFRRTINIQMADLADNISVADILGPWSEPGWDSGLIARCREAWNKPLRELSRHELATLLRQTYAVEHLLPVAKKRLEDGIDDSTEMFDGELQEAVESASRAV